MRSYIHSFFRTDALFGQHTGFSYATRRIQRFTIRGGPGFFPCLTFHFNRTAAGCQPIRVSDLKRRMHSWRAAPEDAAAAFRRTASAASGTFCRWGVFGPRFCLRSTICSCWRSSRISTLFSLSDCGQPLPDPAQSTRQTAEPDRTARNPKNLYPHRFVSTNHAWIRLFGVTGCLGLPANSALDTYPTKFRKFV